MSNKVKWIFLGLIVFVSLFFFIMNLMKGEAYELSLQKVKENDQVIKAVGLPIEPSWYLLGSISTSGPDGTARLEYVIKGNISKAKVYAYASKKVGLWKIDKLVVAPVNKNERITVISEN